VLRISLAGAQSCPDGMAESAVIFRFWSAGSGCGCGWGDRSGNPDLLPIIGDHSVRPNGGFGPRQPAVESGAMSCSMRTFWTCARPFLHPESIGTEEVAELGLVRFSCASCGMARYLQGGKGA